MNSTFALAAAFAVALSGAAASAQTTAPNTGATMPGAMTPENGSNDIQSPGAGMPAPANTNAPTTPFGTAGGPGPASSATGGTGSSH